MYFRHGHDFGLDIMFQFMWIIYLCQGEDGSEFQVNFWESRKVSERVWCLSDMNNVSIPI